MNELVLFLDAALYGVIGLSFIVLGIVVLIRFAGFPDLTVDGSFTISAALFAAAIAHGEGPMIPYLLAILAGALSGALTWTLNQVMGMGRVVSGVLAMITLLLISPYVVSQASIGLLHPDELHVWLGGADRALSLAVIGADGPQLHFATSAFWVACFAVFGWIWLALFRSPPGLRLRYLGSAQSPNLVERSQRKWLLLFGLMVGNGLIGFGAGIEAVRRGGFSANMGLGTLLTGLAIMILGEAIVKAGVRRDYLKISEQGLAIILGVIVYGLAVQAVLRFGPSMLDVRLAATLMLIVALSITARFFPNSAKLF